LRFCDVELDGAIECHITLRWNRSVVLIIAVQFQSHDWQVRHHIDAVGCARIAVAIGVVGREVIPMRSSSERSAIISCVVPSIQRGRDGDDAILLPSASYRERLSKPFRAIGRTHAGREHHRYCLREARCRTRSYLLSIRAGHIPGMKACGAAGVRDISDRVVRDLDECRYGHAVHRDIAGQVRACRACCFPGIVLPILAIRRKIRLVQGDDGWQIIQEQAEGVVAIIGVRVIAIEAVVGGDEEAHLSRRVDEIGWIGDAPRCS